MYSPNRFHSYASSTASHPWVGWTQYVSNAMLPCSAAFIYFSLWGSDKLKFFYLSCSSISLSLSLAPSLPLSISLQSSVSRRWSSCSSVVESDCFSISKVLCREKAPRYFIGRCQATKQQETTREGKLQSTHGSSVTGDENLTHPQQSPHSTSRTFSLLFFLV